MTSISEKIIVGLTGSIASGKTTSLKAFSRLGWATLSTDEIVAEILSNDRMVISEIFKRWGKAVRKSCGSVDKPALGALVFANKSELKWLESLIHPIVRDKWSSFALSHSNERCMIELPLLFENNLQKNFSHLVTVYAPTSIIRARLRQRGIDDCGAGKRIDSQMSALQKVALSGFVLWGGGARQFLQDQVVGLNHLLK